MLLSASVLQCGCCCLGDSFITAHRTARRRLCFHFVCLSQGGRGGVPIPQCIAKPSHNVVPYPPPRPIPAPDTAPPYPPPITTCPRPRPAPCPPPHFFLNFFFLKFFLGFFLVLKFFFLNFFFFFEKGRGAGGTPLAVTQEDCLVSWAFMECGLLDFVIFGV